MSQPGQVTACLAPRQHHAGEVGPGRRRGDGPRAFVRRAVYVFLVKGIIE
jgi:hypothetical protein